MKKMELKQMEIINGGTWLAWGCGLGVSTLEASFAFPVLFAFTCPITVGICAAAAVQAAM